MGVCIAMHMMSACGGFGHYVHILITAIRLCLQSALAVAFINIRIPLLIGGLVNVLSKYAIASSESVETSTGCCSFMEDIKQPAMQLISMYALQVCKHC